MSDAELGYRSASGLAAAVRRRSVSPVEVVDAVLARIERLNPALNAYCTVAADTARAAARAAEARVMRGEPLGPLHGVPVSVKDTLWTAGIRTTMGSTLFADFVPAEDAAVVARLAAAGAILVGKTNTPEFAFKGATDNRLFGITRNPWALDHTPGGSTGGGAAAVAAGLGPLAVGTDEGGSIRLPASFCGVVGLKPTFGLVARYPVGVAELLTHVGPLTRTVEDAALFLAVAAGRDDRDGWSLPGPPVDYAAELARPPERPLRVAWSPRLGYGAVEPEVVRITMAGVGVLEALGWHVEEADPGFEDPASISDAFRYPALAAVLGDRLAADRDRMDPLLVDLVEAGQRMSGADVAAALMRRHALWLATDAFFQRFDLLATPVVSVPPFRLDAGPPREVAGRAVSRRGWTPFTYPFNLAGVPAIALPCGWTPEGLPVGLQLVARRLDDALLLRAAAAFEAAAPWADRRPALG